MFSNEKIIEVKTCKHCNSSFEITDKDLEFYEKVSPNFNGKKYTIPTPTLCPDCRQQRRLAWRNRRNMYKRNCDASGKPIISMFSPGKPYKVYYTKIWESDNWNPLNYGKDFDFNKTFFNQFNELLQNVPLPHLAIIESTLENSEYVNGANNLKNCYLSSNIVNCENTYYSEDIYNSSNCLDSTQLNNCRDCFCCINSINLSNCKFLFECENSNNSIYCDFCKGCQNCIGCIGLENKSYHILNKEYSREEYFKIIKNINIETLRKDFYELKKTCKYKCLNNINSENILGDNIINSKNCVNSFDIRDCENIRNSIFVVGNSKDCSDICFWGENLSLSYEGTSTGLNSNKILFSAETYDNVKNAFYCYFCYPNCSNLFGCIGVKNKEYCILNKQYSKEEYEKLLPKIIEHMQKTGEWGEFFPALISPFGYNETVAQEYFPLTRRDVFEKHLYQDGTQIFNWSNYEPPFPKVDKIIKASMLPDDISKIPDDILNWAIECEVSGKPFRIVKAELEFYRKHELPIPKRHPDQRHLDRLALRNPRRLFDRKCDKCEKNIKTTYSPDRKEIVYCESCYEKEVY